MEFIIILITSIVLATTLIAYFVTKGQPPMEDFLEDDKDVRAIITPNSFRSKCSPELSKLLEASDELSKQLDEYSKTPAFMENLHNINPPSLMDSLHNVSQPSLEDVEVEPAKKKYQPKAPKVKK